MKKLLTLLLTIAYTTQLYGMKKETENLGTFDELPEDIHIVIFRALATSNDIGQTIEAINIASALRGVKYDNLKDFTKLVHVLANKFNLPTGDIAKKIKTQIADRYFDLFTQLQSVVFDTDANIEYVKELIKQGADVNGSGPGKITPLMHAIPFQNIDIITLLLTNGANPNTETGKTTMTNFVNLIFNNAKRKQITQLLEDASNLRSFTCPSKF